MRKRPVFRRRFLGEAAPETKRPTYTTSTYTALEYVDGDLIERHSIGCVYSTVYFVLGGEFFEKGSDKNLEGTAIDVVMMGIAGSHSGSACCSAVVIGKGGAALMRWTNTEHAGRQAKIQYGIEDAITEPSVLVVYIDSMGIAFNSRPPQSICPGRVNK
jgi:hypothetical protein